MSTNTTALAEQNHENIKAIMDSLDMKRSKRHTGASRKEKRQAAAKKSVLGLSKGEDGDDTRSDKAVRDDLRQQNAQNLLRLADELGVPKRKLSGEASATDVEEQKADVLGLPTDGDDTDDRSKAEFFGLGSEDTAQ